MVFAASFAADASEGLSYMHSVGVVHCDHKLVNTLVCRSNGPARFVGKVTDPGVWCGESRFGRVQPWDFRRDKTKTTENTPRLSPSVVLLIVMRMIVHQRFEDTLLEFRVRLLLP